VVLHRSGLTAPQFNTWMQYARDKGLPSVVVATSADLVQKISDDFEITEAVLPIAPPAGVNQQVVAASPVLMQLQQVNTELESALILAKRKEQQLVDESLKIMEEAETLQKNTVLLENELSRQRTRISALEEEMALKQQKLDTLLQEHEAGAKETIRELNRQLAERTETIAKAKAALAAFKNVETTTGVAVSLLPATTQDYVGVATVHTLTYLINMAVMSNLWTSDLRIQQVEIGAVTMDLLGMICKHPHLLKAVIGVIAPTRSQLSGTAKFLHDVENITDPDALIERIRQIAARDENDNDNADTKHAKKFKKLWIDEMIGSIDSVRAPKDDGPLKTKKEPVDPTT